MDINNKVTNRIFTFLLFIVFCFVFIESLSFHEVARFFPMYIAIVAMTLIFLESVLLYFREKRSVEKKSAAFHPNLKGAIKYIFIVISYLLIIYILGFKIATAVFLAIFLRFESAFGWLATIIAVTLAVLFLYVFGDLYMNINWPKSLMNF